MPKPIKARLAILGKTQRDMLFALKAKYPKLTVSPSDLSLFIAGVYNTPKSQDVLDKVNMILSEWEANGDQEKPKGN